jgi:hypothetical protein
MKKLIDSEIGVVGFIVAICFVIIPIVISAIVYF